MLRVRYDSHNAEAKLAAIKLALEDPGLRKPLERAAWTTRTGLIKETPKRWTGNTRKGWTVSNVAGQPGSIRVHNDSKVMRYLDQGTDKVNPDGYIYPKVKKWLYIPLHKGAMIWRPGLVMGKGKDFLLAKRVRGIKPMRIVEKYQPIAFETLRAEAKAYLESIVK